MSVDIDRGRPDDLELLVELEEASFDPREQWSESSWAAELHGGDRDVWVVRSGAGELLAAATTQTVGDVADLHRIVVLGSERRHGVGTALLRHAMEAARRRGARRMMLEVRADNAAALSVYARAGFVEIDRRPGYYGRGSDAVVMRCRLGGADDDD